LCILHRTLQRPDQRSPSLGVEGCCASGRIERPNPAPHAPRTTHHAPRTLDVGLKLCSRPTPAAAPMATTPDLTLLITSQNSTSERRVTPSWTVAHFKARLEPITGIPAGCQRLSLKIASETPQPIEAANEDVIQLAAWPLQANAEIHVGSLLQTS